MRFFDIRRPDNAILGAVTHKIDNLNKPKGSLGMLEHLARQICLVQQTLTPHLNRPCHLLFAADHGIEREGVSIAPRDVTWQQMINFTRGGGGVNMLCRQHGFSLRLIDMGVDHDLSTFPDIVNRKIARGTRNFLHGPAMTAAQLDRAVDIGAAEVDACAAEGCDIVCVGEMGIANTSASALWMSVIGGVPLDECVGVGSGLDDDGLRHKKEILARALARYNESQTNSPLSNRISDSLCASKELSDRISDSLCVSKELSTLNSQLSTLHCMSYFGGFEMVAAVGAFLRAAERHMVILVDGFIMTACMLAAAALCPEVVSYAVFGHCGDEHGHRRLLRLMNARPLLSLGMRLGEGTGALCAFPVVDSAVRMVNEMNSFDNADITKYF